jgi:hypothetical protein
VKDFEQIGTRAFYRPTGQVTVEQAIELLAEAIRTARGLGLADMLVDATQLGGLGNPDVFARYAVGTTWAAEAGSQLCVAAVVRPELIDSQKIAAVVAQNRHAFANVFATEVEAIKWLNLVSARVGRPGSPRQDGQ